MNFSFGICFVGPAYISFSPLPSVWGRKVRKKGIEIEARVISRGTSARIYVRWKWRHFKPRGELVFPPLRGEILRSMQTFNVYIKDQMSCHLGAINFECLPRNSHATVTNSPSPSSRLCLFFLALIKPDWQSLPRRRSDRAKETIEKKSLLDRFSTGQRTDAQSFCFVQHLLLVSLSLQLLLDSFTMNIGFCRFPLLTTQYSGVDFCYIYGYNGGKSVYREESRLWNAFCKLIYTYSLYFNETLPKIHSRKYRSFSIRLK